MNRIDVTKKAKSYLGCWGNPNQFTRWFSKDNQSHAWCGMFIDYVFKKDLDCDWLDSCSNFAYVPTIVKWAKAMGYWNTDFKKAKEGDLIVYNWKPENKNHYSHIGIVKKINLLSATSIEGNTTNGTKNNCVAKKDRNKKYIAGVILLPYVEQFNLTRILKKGCRGDDVKELQVTLVQKGYSVGKYGADGIFGDSTKKAVQNFQKLNRLKTDGIVGKNTAHKLGWLYKGK